MNLQIHTGSERLVPRAPFKSLLLCLFNDVQVSQILSPYSVEDWVILKIKLQGFVRKRSWLYLRYYVEVCLEGLRRTMKS